MEPEGIKTIAHHANMARRNLPLLADRIKFRRQPEALAGNYLALSRSHVALGMYDYFVTGSLRNFQHHFHVAARLKAASIDAGHHQPWTVGRTMFYALLSGNPPLIAAAAHMAPRPFIENRNDPSRPEFTVHLWQLALRGDHEKLRSRVRQLDIIDDQDFFSLLMQGDKAGLEALITRHARARSDDPLMQDALSVQATLEARICWLQGISVQIDSPWLPMAVLPVAPLDHYSDAYEFLSPGYVPPTLGLLEMLGYWFRDRDNSRPLPQPTVESF